MRVCEPVKRKVFKIGNTLAVSIPDKMRNTYYEIKEEDEVWIGVFSSDKGFHFSFWKVNE